MSTLSMRTASVEIRNDLVMSEQKMFDELKKYILTHRIRCRFLKHTLLLHIINL